MRCLAIPFGILTVVVYWIARSGMARFNIRGWCEFQGSDCQDLVLVVLTLKIQFVAFANFLRYPCSATAACDWTNISILPTSLRGTA
jgi:hypothetical protein